MLAMQNVNAFSTAASSAASASSQPSYASTASGGGIIGRKTFERLREKAPAKLGKIIKIYEGRA